MKPWKRVAASYVPRPVHTLQWGHGDEAVEEAAGRWTDHGHQGGFNGATAMKPWKRARD